MSTELKKPENCLIVIFGASGDLTKRKLMPALYELFCDNMLPEQFVVLGTSSSKLNDDEFREHIRSALSVKTADPENSIDKFLKKLYYISADFKDPLGYEDIRKRMFELEGCCGNSCNYVYYLATVPELFGTIALNLGNIKLSDQSKGFSRIVVEKPFGHDLGSAVELNKTIQSVFKEDQIYRIDHYLGKETVQNVLVTRFANGIFEPIWNRNYVHHVEVTSAETLGVENRGAYYERSGALLDMIQSHLLRVAALVAMEPPSSFDSDAVRNEQLKVLQSLRPIRFEDVNESAVRGQYISSKIKGKTVKGYREENNVNPNSRTETYAAIKFYIDNWRWGGVPFYIRTGKMMPTQVTEAVIHFKKTPHYLFSKAGETNSRNSLILRIQPDEGIVLKFGMKEPGAGYKVQNVNMDFHYKDLSNLHIPEAYERLLYDCMIGDSTLFLRADAVEAAWRFIDPIEKAWKESPDIKIYGYPAGTWGPEAADNLIEGGYQTWRYPCKNLVEDGVYCEL